MVGVERFELPTSCSQSLQQGKTGILGNCVFATFSKNIKQLTYAGCQSEIPPNSPRFRMNRKYCYQSATKFSMVYLWRRLLKSILQEWACGEVSDWCFHMRKHLGINASNYFMYQWAGPVRCPLPLNHQALPSHTSQSAQKESLTIRGWKIIGATWSFPLSVTQVECWYFC